MFIHTHAHTHTHTHTRTSVVLPGRHNRVLQAGLLKQQKSVLSQSWRLEVWDQRGGRVVFGAVSQLGLGMALSLLSPCAFLSLCLCPIASS